MAFTSAKMGLRIWNLLTDLYDHNQLADNWAKVDYHDHSPGKGVQIPTEGIADSAITGPKLAAALDPSGAYTTYRNLWTAYGDFGPLTTQTYLLGPAGFNLIGDISSAHCAFYFDATEHVVPGRTAKLDVRVALHTNAIAPAVTYTFGMRPVATFGGASGETPKVTAVGTALVGSTVVYATPTADAHLISGSGDFDIPASGWYVLSFDTNTNTAANAHIQPRATLRVRYV